MRPAEHSDCDGRHDQRDYHRRDASPSEAGPEKNDQTPAHRRGDGPWIGVAQVPDQPGRLAEEFARCRLRCPNAEEVGRLAHHDRDGDAGRKAARDRVRDEFDQGADAGDAHQDQNPAGHDGRQKKAVEAIPLDHEEDDRHESRRRTGDLNAAPAEGRDDKARDDGGEEPHGRGRERRGDADRHARHSEGEREGEGDQADGYPRADIGKELLSGVASVQELEAPRSKQPKRARPHP